MPVTPQLVIEGIIWVLDREANDKDRPLRAPKDGDITNLINLQKQLQDEWFGKRHDQEEYYSWRHARLDVIAAEKKWSLLTRNLYASTLSVINSWRRRGRSAATMERLAELRPGAEAILKFLPEYQPYLIFPLPKKRNRKK